MVPKGSAYRETELRWGGDRSRLYPHPSLGWTLGLSEPSCDRVSASPRQSHGEEALITVTRAVLTAAWIPGPRSRPVSGFLGRSMHVERSPGASQSALPSVYSSRTIFTKGGATVPPSLHPCQTNSGSTSASASTSMENLLSIRSSHIEGFSL